MKKIFLTLALLVISAAFLTGCAEDEALAGEATATCLELSGAELERYQGAEELAKESGKKVKIVMEKTIAPDNKALAGEAIGIGGGIIFRTFLETDKCECTWKIRPGCRPSLADNCMFYDCSACE
ncbi:hypothetical protein GOV03_00615 [Candidatus Woesearchaeota archaeon]|nr:hypothetical protein [Candidatus Woesearchaeota archaeon]